jgi:ABC-2 type transport system ATP-binding protein
MEPVIELRNVSKRFGTHTVLDRLDLAVPRGSVFGFLGNNGAGKSTTIRLITGLLQADSGEVLVNGRDVRTHRTEVLQGIGCIVDAPALYPNLGAAEFLRIGCAIRRLPHAEIGRVLDLVRLGDTGATRIAHFSLGMKARLALAHALLGLPRLLVLDEPANGLDPHGILEMRALLRALANETDCTVFVSSHQLDEVEKMATHVALLQNGVLASQGRVDVLTGMQGGVLEVEIGDAGHALAVLRARDYHARQTGATSLAVHGVERGQADAVHAALVHAGVRLFQSRYRQPTLEQWFLGATGAPQTEEACS